MKRVAIIAILLAGPVLALGQQNNNIPSGTPTNQVMPGTEHNQQIITPPPTTQVYNGGGGYGWGGGGQTPQGAALQGLSQVISAQGQANLANSAAAINYTQAESNQLRNNVQNVQTFWAMRDIGREEREKERGPRPTPEELARRARAGAPRQLNTNQIDPVTGKLYWPSALQQDIFNDQRAPVDDLASKWVKYGTLDYSDQTVMRQNIDGMFDTLKGQITVIPPQDYTQCRSFLQSLLYATTRTTF
jgi:hypothetical protein